MPRVRLVVHLGLHKTGTTSIQHYLCDHPYPLHACGTLYPTTGRHHLATAQHAVLSSAFQDGRALAGVFALARPINRDVLVAALRDEIACTGCSTVVVSSEGISRYSPRRSGPCLPEERGRSVPDAAVTTCANRRLSSRSRGWRR